MIKQKNIVIIAKKKKKVSTILGCFTVEIEREIYGGILGAVTPLKKKKKKESKLSKSRVKFKRWVRKEKKKNHETDLIVQEK